MPTYFIHSSPAVFVARGSAKIRARGTGELPCSWFVLGKLARALNIAEGLGEPGEHLEYTVVATKG